MKETKEERADRQSQELWRFIQVLAAAGNVVEEELRFDRREADPTQEPPIPRKWRFDVAMPTTRLWIPGSHLRIENIAIEVEGFGRHQSMAGFVGDLEKYSEGFAQGWTILRVSRAMIADGTALEVLARRGVRVEAPSTKTEAS
jgi:hypothetical protein